MVQASKKEVSKKQPSNRVGARRKQCHERAKVRGWRLDGARSQREGRTTWRRLGGSRRGHPPTAAPDVILFFFQGQPVGPSDHFS